MIRRIQWKATPRPRIKDKAGRGQSGRIPASTIINFSALILLFAAVFGLQHLWQRIQGTPSHDTAVSAKIELPANKAATKDEVSVTEEAAVAVEKPAAVEEPVAIVEVPKASEALQEVTQPEPEKQALVEEAAKQEKRPEEKHKRSWLRHEIESPISVEDLDNEAARLGYLAENKRLSGPGMREAVKARPSYQTSSIPRGDFIPFEQGSER